ncbi:carbohydrate binding domain-containing protein [Aureitalea sp. L0-47]|uniref:carbohydrate binding domain-containing protein n=1 Tax=Aureitalea sp. L0-47 TaxID=2816962 RepID=UPI00223832FA|nr:carbohydrate binding domain-containing protein [Aureitalea sp. L0-47]MCW5518518.1 carbohydrate binding domain-containing protein [Aureitalea sp. L0-47]
MRKIFRKRTVVYLLPAVLLALILGCQPDDNNLPEASFPDIAEVFLDVFSPGLQYDAFGTSNVTAFDVDNEVAFESSASLRFDVPNTSDPNGGFAGGVFTVEGGRNLTNYNVLTFYARASKGENIDIIGFGLTFQGETYRTDALGLQVGTDWQQYYIPIPNGAKLEQEGGMLWLAEAADDGSSYQLWIDEVKFDNLNTIIQESAAILEGQDQVIPDNVGDTFSISGASVTYNLPNGLLQSVSAAPAYFDYVSSNESIATVDETGLVTVVGEGVAFITATLGGAEVEGSLQIGMEPLPPSPNVDDSNAAAVSMPVGFESTTLTYDIEGFEGAASSIITNPDPTGINPTNRVVSTTKTNGSAFFAGTLLNLEVPIDFSTSEIFTMKTWSPKANIPVRLALENQAIGGDSQVFIDVNTSMTNQWEELVFNFTGQIDGAIAYDRVIVFFEFIPDLPGDGSTYYYDDLYIAGSDPVNGGGGGGGGGNLLANGDFEGGATAWFGNAFNIQCDGGNCFNFADIAVAGQPFDVNLSQIVEIVQGESYTFTFEAATDPGTGTRTIIAGIGLNEAPFTADTEVVTLTETLQTFEYTFTASFGLANSRVLFDMGAETGVVVIDNVSLIQN